MRFHDQVNENSYDSRDMLGGGMMSNNKIIGIALIIAGIVLCFLGYHFYEPAYPSAVGRAFGGHALKKTYILAAAGLVTLVLGAVKVKQT